MSIYNKATLAQIPSGYKASGAKLYSVLPANGDGDFTVSTDADATRIDENGFIESTVANQARLSRNFIDGVVQPDPFLLLEPTRTNLFINSNSFVSSNWFKSNLTALANQTTSPTGENNASLITATVDNGLLAEFNEWTSTQRTASFFVKKNTSSVVEILNASSTGNFVRYDLENGSILSEGGTMTGEIENYGNGWYRVIATYSISSGTNTFGFRITNAGSVYIYGAQIEEASYATSYIPTGASTVTRTIDYASGAGDINTFNDSEGTLFIDAAALGNDGTYRVINISDGTSSNRVLIQLGNNNNQIRADLVSGGVTQTSLSTTSYTFTNFNKIAFKYKGNDTALFVNGIQVGTTQTGKTMPTGLDRIDFTNGSLPSTFYFRGKLKQLMYFDTALSNSELIQLTS